MGTYLRPRGVLVRLDPNRLSEWEYVALAEDEARGGFPEMRMRVDPALARVAASRELDRAQNRLRLIRFDGRTAPRDDLPPRGGAIWP